MTDPQFEFSQLTSTSYGLGTILKSDRHFNVFHSNWCQVGWKSGVYVISPGGALAQYMQFYSGSKEKGRTTGGSKY
jgi:hypothetical protein